MPKFTKQQKELIESNPIALSTVNKDGSPNVIAIACAEVVSANQILITDNFMQQTVENLKVDNRVCLAVWNKDWQGIKLIGTVDYLTEGKWARYVKKMKDNKGLPAKGAILFTTSKVIKLG